MCGPPADFGLTQRCPGLDHGVGVQRDRADALRHQPLRKVRVVAGALAADADVFALGQPGLDGLGDQRGHRRVALVKVSGQQLHARVAIQTQGELGQIV